MCLREILQKIVEDGESVLLCDPNKDWDARDLLNNLSEPMLKRKAHHQPGLYIAEIDDSGYLGKALYKVKQRA